MLKQYLSCHFIDLANNERSGIIHDRQKVVIRVWGSVASGSRAKQNHLLQMRTEFFAHLL